MNQPKSGHEHLFYLFDSLDNWQNFLSIYLFIYLTFCLIILKRFSKQQQWQQPQRQLMLTQSMAIRIRAYPAWRTDRAPMKAIIITTIIIISIINRISSNSSNIIIWMRLGRYRRRLHHRFHLSNSNSSSSSSLNNSPIIIRNNLSSFNCRRHRRHHRSIISNLKIRPVLVCQTPI